MGSFERYFDSQIVKLIEQSEKDGGIWLKDVEPDQLIEVYTQKSIYRLALVDKVKHLVAVNSTGAHIDKPEICILNGSTFGGSMIRLGWIGIGMNLEFHRRRKVRPILTTSAVKTIKVKKDSKAAQELIEKANKNTAKNTLS